MTTKKLKSKAILASLCFLTPGLLASGEVWAPKVESGQEMESMPNEVQRMFLEHLSRKQRKGVARVSSMWNYLGRTFSDDFPKEKFNIDFDHRIYLNSETDLQEAIDKLKKNPAEIFQVRLRTPLTDYSVLDFDNVWSVFVEQGKTFDAKQWNALQIALNTKAGWFEFGLVGYGSEYLTQEHIGFLSPLVNNPNLVGLTVYHFKFSSQNLKDFLHLLKDKYLHLSLRGGELGAGITDIQIGRPASKNIRVLTYFLPQNFSIVSLDLSLNGLNDEDVDVLVLGLVNNRFLKDLDLSENNYITPSSMTTMIEAINKNPNCKITKLSFKSLVFKAYHSDPSSYIKPFADALKRNNTIQFLDLSFAWFNRGQIGVLVDALKDNKTLLEIKLDGAKGVSNKEKKQIAEILKRNTLLLEEKKQWQLKLKQRIAERETEID